MLFWMLIFLAAALAGWLGQATEQLAERSGEGVGGSLNATFGNATELVIRSERIARRVARCGEGLSGRLNRWQYSAGAGCIHARWGATSEGAALQRFGCTFPGGHGDTGDRMDQRNPGVGH